MSHLERKQNLCSLHFAQWNVKMLTTDPDGLWLIESDQLYRIPAAAIDDDQIHLARIESAGFWWTDPAYRMSQLADNGRLRRLNVFHWNRSTYVHYFGQDGQQWLLDNHTKSPVNPHRLPSLGQEYIA